MSETESIRPEVVPVAERPSELVHVTVDDGDAPAACTMYPFRVPEERAATAWLTAHEGSFVALQEMR